jgi:hypothetical protein
MLAELAAFAKGFRHKPAVIGVMIQRCFRMRAERRLRLLVPAFRLQHVDDEFAAHQVDEAAAEVQGQILVFHFGI